jgi:shikimate kinase
MGTGKSSVGKVLAKRLGRGWVDIDQRIEEAQGRKISEIFEKDGEARFRQIEKEAVLAAAGTAGQVITTGGGVVLDAENMKALKANGLIIALAASAQTIYSRVKDSRHRPLLQGDKMGEIERLLEQRKPLYEKADLTFRTDGKNAPQVAGEIAAALESGQFGTGKDRA